MTEMNRNDSNLEQRLRNHYQQRYDQSPDPGVVWARLLPHLHQQEEARKGWNQAGFARFREGLLFLVEFFVTKQEAVGRQILKEDDLMKNDTEVNKEVAYDPHLTQEVLPLRRRLQHRADDGPLPVRARGPGPRVVPAAPDHTEERIGPRALPSPAAIPAGGALRRPGSGGRRGVGRAGSPDPALTVLLPTLTCDEVGEVTRGG